MTRWAAVPVGVLLFMLLGACREEAASPPEVKPTIHVLTSLPLLFDEGFGLEPATGEAAKFLRDHFTLKPIDLPSQLPPGATLLAAQPRALPAEELVALDAWVRNGGKLVLYVDPMLEWPSKRALGDPLRPPISFADTGLLLHWGLRLDAPNGNGPKSDTHNVIIEDISIGSLVKVGGDCLVEQGGWMAFCLLGKGEAKIVAEADFLDFTDDPTPDGKNSFVLQHLESLLKPSKAEAK